MKHKQNCWDFKKCNRGPDQSGNNPLNICPAATDTSCDKINGGTNGGRICWIVAGTFCDGKVQGTFAQKRPSCITCSFLNTVEAEEGYEEFNVLMPGQGYKPINTP